MKKIIILLIVLLFVLGCKMPIDSKYHFDNPQKAFNWIVNNFEYKVVGYKSPSETLEIGEGDCFTLSLLFCDILQNYSTPPEIVSGPWGQKSWHTVAKINNTYFDLALNKIYLKNPFPGYSFSMPWRLANCYKYYTKFVEKNI
jgi:hypothetical protein